MRIGHRVLVGFCGLFFTAICSADAPRKITVEAGKFDRRDTIVQFALPKPATGQLHLVTSNGTRIPVQTEGLRAWFILASLKAGEETSFDIEPFDADAPAPFHSIITLTKVGGALKFTEGDRDILTYQGEKTPVPEGIEPVFQRGGYIHPVYTPSGKLLTDDYAPDHKHHHGIWSPWTKTEYEGRHPDFWNMGAKTGRVEFDSFGDTWSGFVCGGFRTNHKFIDMTASPEKPALTEVWDVVVFRPVKGKRSYFIFDITTTQNVVDSPLTLPKYHYGGMGFRGRREWKGVDGITFLTSEGKDRKNGNETRGRWCWAGGPAEDAQTIGITIMDHPGNFRSPQPMRLNPDQPFFCYAPSQLGDWKIEKGTPYVARYRFITADGAADVEEIERLWNDFADPPKVTVE